MADKNLTLWEELVLTFFVGLAKKVDDGAVSRTDIQRIQPELANLLKKYFSYKIGKTPEKTVDKIIQDLEKKGFLEMLFRRGWERGRYKVNIPEAEQALKRK